MTFKMLLAAAALATITACSGSSGGDAKTPIVTETVAADTRIAAVMIHADWCGSCKAMAPKLAAVRAMPAIDGVQFITLDYTAKDKDAFFAAADTAGIGEVIRAQFANGVKTGVLLVVDVDNNTLESDLRKELSAEEIYASIFATATAG